MKNRYLGKFNKTPISHSGKMHLMHKMQSTYSLPSSLSRRFCNIFPVFIWYSGHSVNISLNFKQPEVKTDICEKFNEDN